ncbi:MAG TPA: hypothetical protein VHL11_10530, partial [Phototrophicaceae bacterium]|nr:hypothetical protein [Phototrophicaceae bacterium]
SAAFSQNPISRIFVGTFLRFSGSSGGNSTNEMQEKAEDALAFLESLKPGSTTGIDWDQLLTIRPGTAELRA